MAAAFTCASLGIAPTVRHSDYIASWLSVLRGDEKAIYRKIGAGTFPPQYKIAERCCGWRESEVELWMRNPITFTIEDIPTPLHQHYVANTQVWIVLRSVLSP